MKITEKEFLEAELNTLNLTMNNPDFVELAQQVADYLKKYQPDTVIDFGCGTGVYSEVMRQNDFNIVAQDIFKSHRDYCKDNYPDLKVIARPVKADLMLFIEVAEHMEDQEIQEAVFKINPVFILFSSTPETTDFDIEWGHVNIKQEEQWVEMWKKLGYKVIDKPQTPTLWALMLEKI